MAAKDVDSHCRRGDALQSAGKWAEAVDAYEAALRCDPCAPRPWYSRGCAELSRKDFAAALLCFREALALAPGWLEAEHNLARCLFELGQATEAMAHFRNCAARTELPNSALARAMIAVLIPGAAEEDNASILAARRALARELPPCAAAPARGGVEDRRMRVGYVSSFFHRRNWMKPVWGLIDRHDRSAFEIHLFSAAGPIERDSPDTVHDISDLSNEDAAALIRRCGIDVLIDLNGYSDIRRLPLFTYRPAPVIAGWFNCYATMGLDCFDYLIGDAEVIPADEERFYCERILRVPGSYLAFEVSYPTPAVAVRSGAFTFGSLASQIKVTERVIASWSRILAQTPGTSLLIRNATLGSAGCRAFLEAQFAAHGIGAERLRLMGPAEHVEFLQTYDEIDLALDTFPYNGGTTTTEAIWQGVPVLTFAGDRWASRTSASILRAGGLAEFVRPDPESYEAFAVELANSPETPERLAALRREMRTRLTASAVCDTETFCREMESLYRREFR